MRAILLSLVVALAAVSMTPPTCARCSTKGDKVDLDTCDNGKNSQCCSGTCEGGFKPGKFTCTYSNDGQYCGVQDQECCTGLRCDKRKGKNTCTPLKGDLPGNTVGEPNPNNCAKPGAHFPALSCKNGRAAYCCSGVCELQGNDAVCKCIPPFGKCPGHRTHGACCYSVCNNGQCPRDQCAHQGDVCIIHKYKEDCCTGSCIEGDKCYIGNSAIPQDCTAFGSTIKRRAYCQGGPV